jgi:hypothetical protein
MNGRQGESLFSDQCRLATSGEHGMQAVYMKKLTITKGSDLVVKIGAIALLNHVVGRLLYRLSLSFLASGF